MTRIVVIDAKSHSVKEIPGAVMGPKLYDRIIKPGKGGVDFGSIGPDLSIIVNGFGLVGEGKPDEYFSIGSQLFNGSSIVFRTDCEGSTGDTMLWDYDALQRLVVWYDGTEDVERAIEAGLIRRPEAKHNGVVVWQWPQPRSF